MREGVLKYRREIDGLRAVAVIPVILFHAGFSWFSGGYIGVDVFFVISGYLITSLIIADLEKGVFSIARFYERRARRILPALFFVMLCCIPFAWLWMLPSQFRDFSQSFVAISFFSSNILFWIKSGYFSAASEEKPLLHTWSLAVEEQFYLFFPLLLLVVWRLGRNPVYYLVIIISSLSLLLTEWGWRYQPSANFYLLPFRAWELGAGALCALWLNGRSQASSSVLSILGLGMVIFPVFFYDKYVPFPSLYALVPVVGTVLIILFGSSSTLVGKWLSMKFMVGVGLISFSAYLWHQPLLAFARIRSLTPPSWEMMAILCIASLGLAYITWRFVENPFRNGSVRFMRSRAKVFAFSIVASTVFFASGVFGHLSGGIPQRVPEQAAFLAAETSNTNPRRAECHAEPLQTVPECTYGGRELGAIVIGDSHAAAVIRSIQYAMDDPDKHVLDWTLASCPTISGIRSLESGNPRCGEFVEYALNKSRELDRDVPIFIVNRLSSYLLGPNEPYLADKAAYPEYYLSQHFESRSQAYLDDMARGVVDTACELAEEREVFMFRPFPELKVHVPMHMARSLLFSGQVQRVHIAKAEYLERHRIALDIQDRAAEECGIKIIDPLPYLCTQEGCWGDIDGQPIYYDDDHLSESGGRSIIPAIRVAFEEKEGIGRPEPNSPASRIMSSFQLH
ncbi:acyltransferase family protein [Billgrantia saliphila]|uniref:acyltransferase family protein n=1 Tax=Billgrantia saliphila TaxID=1848458 RepID=UPI000CE53B1E|nr:acyltransferase family protein [Halomonas saliphila]